MAVMGSKLAGKTRFAMTKARHKLTLEKAIGEGKVDSELIDFCRRVSDTDNYFTSSCCSGRILLLGIVKEGSKKDAYFHRKWHREVELGEVLEGLNSESEGMVWFKMEGFILHVGCKDLEACEKVLEGMRQRGVKRGGIMVVKEGKYIVELEGTQEMSVPVKRGSEKLVDDEYVGELVGIANRKMRKNLEVLKGFTEWCESRLN